MPHFSVQYRQRVSGFGALAMGIGRVALPLARKFIVPAAKRIGKQLLVQAAPELIDMATRTKTPKQALKNAIKNTIKKQVEAGRSKSRMSRKRKTATTTTTKKKKNKSFHSKETKETNSTEKSLQLFHKIRSDF